MPKPTSSLPLSVVINTKNAASTLAAALESVKDLASDIIVVDMKSTDETIKIAKKYTSKVIAYPHDHRYADPARNFANRQAREPWVLVLDADEEVSPTLAAWIRSTLEQPEAKTVACYWLPRQNYVFGQWVAHTGWWPDHQARLFQKGKVTWEDGVHRLPKVAGESVYLPADPTLALVHQNYSDVRSFVDRLNRYTDIKAEELAESGSTPKGFTRQSVLTTFFQEFQHRFFQQKGYLDGTVGAGLSLLQASYELCVQLKVLELTKAKSLTESGGEVAKASIQTMTELHKELAYWIADAQVSQTQGLTQLTWRLRRKFRI